MLGLLRSRSAICWIIAHMGVLTSPLGVGLLTDLSDLSRKWWPEPIRLTGLPCSSNTMMGGLLSSEAVVILLVFLSSRARGLGVFRESLSVQKLCRRIRYVTMAGTFRIDINNGLLKIPQRWTNIPNALSTVILN